MPIGMGVGSALTLDPTYALSAKTQPTRDLRAAARPHDRSHIISKNRVARPGPFQRRLTRSLPRSFCIWVAWQTTKQPEREDDHREQEPRDPGAACRPAQRLRHRRRGGADLPDRILRVPQHRARGQPVRAQGNGQHLLARHEPHLRRAGAEDGRARGWRGGAGRQLGPSGLGDGDPEPVPARRQRGELHRPLRRHLEPVRQHAALDGHHRALRRSGGPGGLPPGDGRSHARLLRRDAAQPEAHRLPHRRGGSHRPRARRAADHGQHGLPPHLPALRPRRGHRRAFDHQVHRRPRHLHRRHDRRRRQLRLGRARGSASRR